MYMSLSVCLYHYSYHHYGIHIKGVLSVFMIMTC